MEKIVEYVEKAFKKVPDSKKKIDIMQEVIESMENNANRLISEGKTPEDAVNKAIVEFGDLGEIIDELAFASEVRQKRGKSILWFSIIGSLISVALFIFINLYYTSGIIWWVYPTFAVLWWPLCVFFFGSWRGK